MKLPALGRGESPNLHAGLSSLQDCRALPVACGIPLRSEPLAGRLGSKPLGSCGAEGAARANRQAGTPDAAARGATGAQHTPSPRADSISRLL